MTGPGILKIALVGLPGAGKTTVGRALATLRNVPFVDVDEEVERRAGCSIREVFAREGEPAFRDRERRAVAELVSKGPSVIALGGGGFDDAETRALLLASCTVVWLDLPADILIERLRGGTHRPLLDGDDAAGMLRRLAHRTRFYAEARLRVSAGTSEEMAAQINASLDRIDPGAQQ